MGIYGASNSSSLSNWGLNHNDMKMDEENLFTVLTPVNFDSSNV